MTLVQLGLTLVILFVIMAAGLSWASLTHPTDASIGPNTLLLVMVGTVLIAVAIAGLSLWMQVALYTYVIRNQAGLGIWDSYRQAKPRVLPYLGTSLLVGLVTIGGLLLLIIPGIYWGLLYSFAPLITLVEGKNVPALARSKQLVGGRWWEVFWRTFLFGLLVLGATLAINSFLATIFGILSFIYKPLGLLGSAGQYIASLIVAPIGVIFNYRLYQSLKRTRGEVALTNPSTS